MKQNVDIREIRKEELGKLLNLYAYLHENDTEPPTSGSITSVWEQIQENENIKYFGIFIGDELVSSCNIILVPNLTRSCRPYGVIENVVTHKKYRKNGFGKAILKKATEYAWDNSCYKVMLMTGRLDENTFSFYESAGFDRHSKQAFIIKDANISTSE